MGLKEVSNNEMRGFKMSTALNNLENEYRKFISEKEILTVDEFIDIAIKLFYTIKVDKIDYAESFNDMLLFQYGVYNWGDENGNHFSFDITRQIITPEEDEPYQLSLILIFEPSAFLKIKPYDIWSIDFNSVEDFVKHIKSTSGYKLASKINAKNIQLLFGQC